MTCKKTPGLEKVLTQQKPVRGLKKKLRTWIPDRFVIKKSYKTKYTKWWGGGGEGRGVSPHPQSDKGYDSECLSFEIIVAFLSIK